MTAPKPPLDLVPLQEQLAEAGYDVARGLGMDDETGNHVYTYDADGEIVDLPAEAQSTIDTYLEQARS